MKTGDNVTLSAAIELGFLNDSQLEQIREQSEEENFLGLEIAIRKGFLNRRQLKILEAFRAPLEVAPGYRIDGLIGRGGAGVVYMATQLGLDRPVALKTISGVSKGNALAPQRFEREAKIIGQLRHPNIVSAVDFGVHESQLYLVMEFVEGMDAEKYQEQSGTLPETSVWYIAKQVCNALAYANERGVIHRDIKPGNLIFTTAPNGSAVPADVPFVKIADFGLARFKEPTEDNNITIEAAISGTPFYMSPEQIGAMEVDHRSDIYSLGSTLWHLITGSPPVTASTPMDILSQKMKLEDSWLDNCPKEISQKGFELLREMCRFSEDERISDYAELNSKIDSVIQSMTAAPSAANTIDVGKSESTGGFAVKSNVTFFDKMTGYDAKPRFANTISLEQRDKKAVKKSESSEKPAASATGRSGMPKWLALAIGASTLAALVLAALFLFWPSGDGPPIADLEYFENTDLTGPQIVLFNGLSVKGDQKFSGTWEVTEGLEKAPVLSGVGTREFKCVDDDRANLEFFRFDCGFLTNEAEEIIFRLLDDAGTSVFHVAINHSNVTLFDRETRKHQIKLRIFDEKTSGYNRIQIESQPEHWRVMVDANFLGVILKEQTPGSSNVIRVEVEGDGPAHFEQIRFRQFEAKEAVD